MDKRQSLLDPGVTDAGGHAGIAHPGVPHSSVAHSGVANPGFTDAATDPRLRRCSFEPDSKHALERGGRLG